MNNFLYTVGVSYIPLNEKAIEVSKEVGTVEIKRENKKSSFLNAYDSIQKDMEKEGSGLNASL